MIKNKRNNNNLNESRKEKNDEFYTQLIDIEKELKHYKSHFKNKIIYCNCDDPEHSNFFNYFLSNFKKLKLKKLIVSCYKANDKGIYLEYYEGQKLNNKKLNGDGDFRSEGCIELLKQADIVVTNPPFSLFKEYFAQLIKYNKKFLIIGNINAIICKDIFPFIKYNKVWLGLNKKSISFIVPVCWFTNLDYKERHNIKDLILTKKYNSVEYPKYDNYNAINVDKIKDIPIDYDGVMGVPVSFIIKHNPKQFKIVGITSGLVEFEETPTKQYINIKRHNINGSITNNKGGSNSSAKLLWQEKPHNKIYYTTEGVEGYLTMVYRRILIKKIKR